MISGGAGGNVRPTVSDFETRLSGFTTGRKLRRLLPRRVWLLRREGEGGERHPMLPECETRICPDRSWWRQPATGLRARTCPPAAAGC